MSFKAEFLALRREFDTFRALVTTRLPGLAQAQKDQAERFPFDGKQLTSFKLTSGEKVLEQLLELCQKRVRFTVQAVEVCQRELRNVEQTQDEKRIKWQQGALNRRQEELVWWETATVELADAITRRNSAKDPNSLT